MTESDFKAAALRAETMARAASGTDADYWRGYLRGTRRAYYGEALGTQDEHDLYLMAAQSDDPQRRRLGEGYADALAGVCEEDRPGIIQALMARCGWTQKDAAQRLGVHPATVGRWVMRTPAPIGETAWRLVLLLWRHPGVQ